VRFTVRRRRRGSWRTRTMACLVMRRPPMACWARWPRMAANFQRTPI